MKTSAVSLRVTLLIVMSNVALPSTSVLSTLKAELFSKDEAALFTIANEYDVRHSNARQRDDYDEAFLDWTFRWYLATIELSDQLIERRS